MISKQVMELRAYANASLFARESKERELLSQAADTIESLSEKLRAVNMGQTTEDSGGWIPCSNPPKHTNEVLIFNGKSYSVGYYDGKTWVNAIHPVEWQEIRHEP